MTPDARSGRPAWRARSNIRRNIALSLLAIAVLVAAALAGRLSLTSGLLLNEGTALLIIANAAAAPPGNNAGAVRIGLPGLMLGSHHRP